MERLSTAACWVAPGLFCLWLYWYGVTAWFLQDDFAWLGLHTQVHDWPSFWEQMFTPMAQGTIRPWSERGFFLLFYRLFGADALPYHLMVFATQAVNMALLAWIVLQLTASRLAAFAAPVLWTANASLAAAMSWAADYNEILCAFFLLSAFALYLRGRYWLQVVVFVLGFGALELNVVYPALLLAYVITCKRSRADLLRTLPLFAISIAYYALHARVAPGASAGPYALHVDTGMLPIFGNYWRWSFVPSTWTLTAWKAILIVAGFTALTLWHVVREMRLRNFLPIFFLLWFVITIAPLLPLRDHVTEYYLTLPAIGLAMLMAQALGTNAAYPAVLVPAFALVAYLYLQVPSARGHARWYFDRSREVRSIVLGIRHARELHPGKAILLTDVSPQLYSMSVAHSAFWAVDIPDVYITAESARNIPQYGALARATDFMIPAPAAAQGVLNGQIEVYSVALGVPRNITSAYEFTAATQSGKEFPRRVDVGVRFLGYLLGSSWYPLEDSHRWMPQRASLRMGGPRTASEQLVLTGYCPAGQVSQGPLKLLVSVNGITLPETEFSKPESPFSRIFGLPPDLVGQDHVDVTLEVSHTFRASAGERELGLAFGVFEIR
jgi:hypothetical protein